MAQRAPYRPDTSRRQSPSKGEVSGPEAKLTAGAGGQVPGAECMEGC